MSLSIILLLFVLCSVSSINLNGTMKIFGNDYITSILVNHTEEYANFNRYINYTTVQFRIESDQLIEIVLNKHNSETKEDLGFIASIEVENSDGKKILINSNEEWQCDLDMAIINNTIDTNTELRTKWTNYGISEDAHYISPVIRPVKEDEEDPTPNEIRCYLQMPREELVDWL